MVKKLRVVHVTEVANVGLTMVTYAQEMGYPWSLLRLPPGKGFFPWVAGKRALDLPRAWWRLRGADVTHVHYAVNGYLGWKARRFVLHFHGTDLRRDLHSPWLGPVIRQSVKRAAAVIVATPDLLAKARELRADAQWLPNPVPELFFVRTGEERVPGRVIFNMRWDDTKGLEKLLPAAASLVAAGVDAHGLRWGTHVADAEATGMHLHGHMPLADYREFLASADVVVGQMGNPVLSMSELQSLALGKTVVASDTFEGSPVISPGEDLAETVLALLAKNGECSAEERERTAEERREWVRRHHSEGACLERYLKLYSSLAAS